MGQSGKRRRVGKWRGEARVIVECETRAKKWSAKKRK